MTSQHPSTDRRRSTRVAVAALLTAGSVAGLAACDAGFGAATTSGSSDASSSSSSRSSWGTTTVQTGTGSSHASSGGS